MPYTTFYCVRYATKRRNNTRNDSWYIEKYRAVMK